MTRAFITQNWLERNCRKKRATVDSVHWEVFFRNDVVTYSLESGNMHKVPQNQAFCLFWFQLFKSISFESRFCHSCSRRARVSHPVFSEPGKARVTNKCKCDEIAVTSSAPPNGVPRLLKGQ